MKKRTRKLTKEVGILNGARILIEELHPNFLTEKHMEEITWAVQQALQKFYVMGVR